MIQEHTKKTKPKQKHSYDKNAFDKDDTLKIKLGKKKRNTVAQGLIRTDHLINMLLKDNVKCLRNV